ncbi:GroES-like protein [Hortaea werneckii]|uniref:Enoyl reductase (ER) domain-containing protein n=2 Tax=Hortaea werneckii TaxID=91943 RepID=A0A3M7E759_HORWE|nr:GroES-like protein [Hortaea werneckii]KAI6895666.1 GroES-like protein [Hortaea werneckii]KAI6895700.1 GroES-like protein [Hortaea werneckii]KAI7105146.1 GroES-like protein [Hortaea werneckii]KAI7232919.1 GroES-like protein [Hortaea werneckii]
MVSFTVYKGSENGAVVAATTEKPELQNDQVLVKVTASGLCGTDLHYKNANMGLGHEGVGVIESVGPQVKYMKKGDRVGWGYEHNSCEHCQQCLRGNETYCPERKMYGLADLDQGSMATHAVWREAFLFQIPDGLSDEDAAPLQCGGATVFNALHEFDTQPTETIGVMGIGGLGHLAIQYAAKMGCRVVVLSGTDSKKEEAMKLGAHEFIATKDAKEIKPSRPIDRLLVCTSAQPQWDVLVPALAPHAVIYPLSVAGGEFTIPYMPALFNGIRVQFSVVASRYIHQRMLDFAALHNIKPIVEKFPMNEKGIKEAMDKLENGGMRYRAVLLPQ